jgi:hypothetical protein
VCVEALLQAREQQRKDHAGDRDALVTAPRRQSNPAVRPAGRTSAASPSMHTARRFDWIVKKLKKFPALKDGWPSSFPNC